MGGYKHKPITEKFPNFPKEHFIDRAMSIDRDMDLGSVAKILFREISGGYKLPSSRISFANLECNNPCFANSINEYRDLKRAQAQFGIELINPVLFQGTGADVEYHLNLTDRALDNFADAVKKIIRNPSEIDGTKKRINELQEQLMQLPDEKNNALLDIIDKNTEFFHLDGASKITLKSFEKAVKVEESYDKFLSQINELISETNKEIQKLSEKSQFSELDLIHLEVKKKELQDLYALEDETDRKCFGEVVNILTNHQLRNGLYSKEIFLTYLKAKACIEEYNLKEAELRQELNDQNKKLNLLDVDKDDVVYAFRLLATENDLLIFIRDCAVNKSITVPLVGEDDVVQFEYSSHMILDAEESKYLDNLLNVLQRLSEGEKIDMVFKRFEGGPTEEKINHFAEQVESLVRQNKGKNLKNYTDSWGVIERTIQDYQQTLFTENIFNPSLTIFINKLVMSPLNGVFDYAAYDYLKSHHRQQLNIITAQMADNTKKYMLSLCDYVVTANFNSFFETRLTKYSEFNELVDYRLNEYMSAVSIAAREKLNKPNSYFEKVKTKLKIMDFLDRIEDDEESKGHRFRTEAIKAVSAFFESKLTESERLYLATGVRPWDFTKTEADEILNNPLLIVEHYAKQAEDVTNLISELMEWNDEELRTVFSNLGKYKSNIQKNINNFFSFVDNEHEKIRFSLIGEENQEILYFYSE